jgi:hypothetical protein
MKEQESSNYLTNQEMHSTSFRVLQELDIISDWTDEELGQHQLMKIRN